METTKRRTTQKEGRRTAAGIRRRLENLRPWQPGQSGNPGGRPRGFARRIQELASGEDYARIAEAFAVLAFGTAAQRKAFFGEAVKVLAKDRLKALVELRDSGPGRPTQSIAASGPVAPLFALPNGIEPDIGAGPRPVTNGRDDRP